MKLVVYSDLHSELQYPVEITAQVNADVLILAGDIVSFSNPEPLKHILKKWKNKPVIYVAGNHEYYTKTPIAHCNREFREYLKDNHPNVHFLDNEGVKIGTKHFFGGTMWTDLNKGNSGSLDDAQKGMNDFNYIYKDWTTAISPEDFIGMHNAFKYKLTKWLRETKGTRVVVTHHSPNRFEDTKYTDSTLWPAFECTDMDDIFQENFVDLWVHGHTHENRNERCYGIPLISNQAGYQAYRECRDFCPKGIGLTV